MLRPAQKKINGKLFRVMLVGYMVSLLACHTNVAVKETPHSATGVKKIFLLPFKNMSKIYGENVNVRCPICGKVIMIGKIEDDVEHVLTTKVFNVLKEKEGLQLIPPSQADGVLPGLMAHNKKTQSEKDMIMEAGRLLGADAVLYGYVYRYEERVGTQYAVDSPASVAFDMHLILVTDGSMLWNGHFDETQQSLSENLFKLGDFIKRKARWISAHEMAITGVENIMKTFPAP